LANFGITLNSDALVIRTLPGSLPPATLHGVFLLLSLGFAHLGPFLHSASSYSPFLRPHSDLYNSPYFACCLILWERLTTANPFYRNPISPRFPGWVPYRKKVSRVISTISFQFGPLGVPLAASPLSPHHFLPGTQESFYWRSQLSRAISPNITGGVTPSPGLPLTVGTLEVS